MARLRIEIDVPDEAVDIEDRTGLTAAFYEDLTMALHEFGENIDTELIRE